MQDGLTLDQWWAFSGQRAAAASSAPSAAGTDDVKGTSGGSRSRSQPPPTTTCTAGCVARRSASQVGSPASEVCDHTNTAARYLG